MSRMICPAAPPSAATAKVSGANWLDRLRSSRGFPPADAVDLDHFLATEASASAAATVAAPPSVTNLQAFVDGRGSGNGGQSGEGLAEILCELFAIGGGGGRGIGEISNLVNCKSKSSRKQQKPKYWDATGSSKKNSNECSSEGFRRQNNNLNSNNKGLASSVVNSLNQHQKERDSKELGVRVEEEEEVDLKGYSKSEVTVIDSSIQGWRSEMFVFRKRKSKSVWKVREKKSKSRSLMGVRRKRKLVKGGLSNKDDVEDNDGGNKRRKKKKQKIMRVLDSAPGSLSKNGNGKEHAVAPLINEGQFRNEKMEQTLNGVYSLHCEAPIKSFPCPSSHRKLKSKASSVILVRPIPTFDESRTGKPGKVSVNKGQSLL